MAHNPKLNVYILTLNNQEESIETFRDLFQTKFILNGENTDEKLFLKYFESFLDGIGKDKFHKDIKAKKVIGAAKVEDEEINYSIKPLIDKNIIHGVIDGGKYGILREYADIDKKENKQKITASNAVLDKFYFLIKTPLNSKFGYLLIQSYTEETIQSPFINFVKPFFSVKDVFHQIIVEPFVPKKFVDKFLDEAKIRMFNFSTITGIGENLRDDDIIIEDQTFEVTINIKPKNDIKPDGTIIDKVLSAIGSKKFDNKKLSDLKSKVFVESGPKKRRANFDIEKELKNIRPTIYLEEEGIDIDANTSMPNFDQIETFCFELLEEIIKEHKESLIIDEL